MILFFTTTIPADRLLISRLDSLSRAVRAGISGVTWHTMRHTFASRLVDRGVDIVTVQQLLGRSTVTVPMRYTHTNLDSKRAAVAKLAAHCGKSVTICTTMQQSAQKPSRLSHSRVVSYNASAG